MNKLSLYPNVSKDEIVKHTYYVAKRNFLFELRQTRFIDHKDHSWDVCAVNTTIEGLKEMTKIFTGSIIWPE